MRKVMQLLRSTLCVFAFVGSMSAFAGQNVLYYQSQPDDYVGQGAEATFTGTDGTFTLRTATPSFLEADFFTPGFVHHSTLDIAAADHAAVFQVGSYEANALLGLARLSFSVDSRGCGNAVGRFDILEIVRDSTGTVTQLAVNWEQRCELNTPALFGQLRFNSNVPVIKKAKINLENPLNARGCVEASSPAGALVSMNANDAVDATGGTSLAFNWSSSTGAVGTASAFSFNAPLTTDPANPVTVTLSITDLTNIFRYTATKPVCVSDATGPVIVINAPVPGQNVFGDSLILDVTIKDAVDKTITQHEVLVGSDYLSTLNPVTGHGRQNVLAKPQATNGSVALTITVRATDASGNTSQKSVTVTQFP